MQCITKEMLLEAEQQGKDIIAIAQSCSYSNIYPAPESDAPVKWVIDLGDEWAYINAEGQIEYSNKQPEIKLKYAV